MKFHRNQFLQKLRKLASDFGILLIADEVFTGFGRTGSDFACKQASIVPDIICLSKAITGGFMPMGLTVCTDEIYSAFHSESRLKTFFHGHSYTGNSLSCAAAVASLELYQQENRLDDVKYINLRMKGELACDELWKSNLVKDIRILGALAVIEFQSDQDQGYLSQIGPILTRKFLEKNILLRPLGNVLYFLPPYSISVESLEYSLKTIKQVILDGF
jgi:adenosylmethionine-8-amino-7-oxononanoate aminotransferase